MRILQNHVVLQSVNSDNCGFFSMRALIMILSEGKSFMETVGYHNKKSHHAKEGEAEIEEMKEEPIQLYSHDGRW